MQSAHNKPYVVPTFLIFMLYGVACCELIRLFFSDVLGQEPRERHPLPNHAWFRPRHSNWSGALPAAEERPEPTDDWRVLGKQQAAIQQGCP